MLNDWKWEKIDNYKYVIRDNNNKIIIDLKQIRNEQWICTLYNDEYEYELRQRAFFPENTTIEEIQWQVTIWISKQCNNIANSFHYIRDHLPSAYDLFDKITKL